MEIIYTSKGKTKRQWFEKQYIPFWLDRETCAKPAALKWMRDKLIAWFGIVSPTNIGVRFTPNENYITA